MLHTTQGIVLKTFKYSETSVIARVYTQKFGLQTYIINSVHAKQSRTKPALLQPLTILDMVVYHREHKTMNHVKELRPAYTFTMLPYDVVKTALALLIAEVLYKTLKEETSNTAQFEFLYHFITLLDQNANPAVTANLHLWFLVKFTGFLGFYPQNNFFYTDRPYFDLSEGTFCHRQPEHGHFIALPLSQLLFRLMQLAADQTAQLEMNRLQRRQLLQALLLYYRFHVDGFDEVKSLHILEEIFED